MSLKIHFLLHTKVKKKEINFLQQPPWYLCTLTLTEIGSKLVFLLRWALATLVQRGGKRSAFFRFFIFCLFLFLFILSRFFPAYLLGSPSGSPTPLLGRLRLRPMRRASSRTDRSTAPTPARPLLPSAIFPKHKSVTDPKALWGPLPQWIGSNWMNGLNQLPNVGPLLCVIMFWGFLHDVYVWFLSQRFFHHHAAIGQTLPRCIISAKIGPHRPGNLIFSVMKLFLLVVYLDGSFGYTLVVIWCYVYDGNITFAPVIWHLTKAFGTHENYDNA